MSPQLQQSLLVIDVVVMHQPSQSTDLMRSTHLYQWLPLLRPRKAVVMNCQEKQSRSLAGESPLLLIWHVSFGIV